jgi:lipopolysaccharide transport system permease protein
MIRNLRELYQYRALLWNLTLRELRARYRASVLGFFWTFLNPTLHMLVYALMFGVFIKQSIVHYPYFLFIGLLPWICFSSSVTSGASSISDRRDLLTKVRFPAQVLPATVVLTNLINYLLSLPLMLGLGLFYGVIPTWHTVFFVLVIAVQTLFTLAISYLLSALNVAFRDLQHIIANLLMLAFFVTPVLWPIQNISEQSQKIVTYGNPMAAITLAYRSIFFDHVIPDAKPLLIVAGMSVVLLWISAQIFERRREEFAELI